MKRFLFIFFILLIFAVGIYSTLMIQKAVEVSTIENNLNSFLNLKQGNYSYDVQKKDFSIKNGKGDINYFLISPIDGVYFHSKKSNPVEIIKSGNSTNIKIDEGQYIFVLNNIFEKYQINGDGFNIDQLGKGIFFVNNVSGDYKIYSFNALINITLLEKQKLVTNFDLFPGLFFKYNNNPEYNDALIGGDIIRVSTVNSIVFLDSKSKDFVSKIDQNNKEPSLSKIFDISLGDISNRFTEYQELYKKVLTLDIEDISGIELISKYSPLFINKTKKYLYFKTKVLKAFFNILKKDKNSTEDIANLNDALSETKADSETIYQDSVSVLKNYYYLSYFSNNLQESSMFEISSENNVDKIIKNILKEQIVGKEYFSSISNVFFAYNFTGLSKNKVDNYLNLYLANLKNSNILKEQDFLYFSFFLTQYSFASDTLSEDTIGILIQLIDIFNSYYITIKDNEKKSGALTMQFFNFKKIIGNVNDNIIKVYFEKRKDGNIYLKSIYENTIGGQIQANIGDKITELLGILYKKGLADLKNKNKDFYFFNPNVDDKSKDNYNSLEEKYTKLGFIYNNVLIDYNAYTSKFLLNNKNRNIQSEIKTEVIEISMDKLKEYLGKFNSVDLSSIKILNEKTMRMDLYYNIQVKMFNNTFEFKLYADPEKKHKISEVVIYDQNGKKDESNKNTTIKLDDKEKTFDEKAADEEDSNKKEKYDFKNFFYTAYLSKDASSDNNEYIQPDKPKKIIEPKEISIFKQDKLIDGDFTYIKDFINIPYTSVIVSIVRGNYIISLENVNKSVLGNNNDYNCILESSYIFNEHAFQNINFRVLQDNQIGGYRFDSKTINILPSKISVKQFSDKMKDLGYYLDSISQNYSSSVVSLKIDLNLSKVFIDSRSFDVIINK